MIKGIAKGLTMAGLGLAFVANTAHAQKPGLEFGVQLVNFQALNPDGSGNNLTTIGLGAGVGFPLSPLGTPANVSVAYYLNEQFALEPTIIYDHVKPEGSDAVTALGLQLAVPIYLKKGWGKAGGFFVAPFIGTNRLTNSGSTISQTHFGANVGTKMKINGSNNLFWRVQAGYDMGQENSGDGLPKYTNISASFGLSAYLH